MINEIVKEIQKDLNGTLLYLTQYGSHLYGLNTENSDLDFRGIYIPSINDLILHKDQDEINKELVIEQQLDELEVEACIDYSNHITFIPGKRKTKKVKVDVKIFSLQKFIKLCSKADTNALDVLYSFDCNHVEQYKYIGLNGYMLQGLFEFKSVLINTNNLQNPISYAFKQATKYGIKGRRRQVMLDLLKDVNTYLFLDTTPADVPLSTFITDFTYEDMTPVINKYFDGKYVRIDILDNKGKEEKYLFVCGVQHQFNLELKRFAQRLEDKINKEYTSQRTIDAADGNDWKALSHALRILFQMKELLTNRKITFPLKQASFLLDVKRGKVERQVIDSYFEQELSGVLQQVKDDPLHWNYDEEFWNKYILGTFKRQELFTKKEKFNEI